MALKQREMNKKALEFAAATIRDSEFDAIFGDVQYEDQRDEKVLDKAREYAVRRIKGLIKPRKS